MTTSAKLPNDYEKFNCTPQVICIEIIVYTQRVSGWDKVLVWSCYIMGDLGFHSTHDILFAVHEKHFSIWSSADIKLT